MATFKAKVISVKPFTARGENHFHFILAYKGRALSASTLQLGDMIADADKAQPQELLTINGNIELRRTIEQSRDIEGNETKKIYLQIMPTLDLNIVDV